MLHPREALLQTARAFQRSPAFAPSRRLRHVAEHRLARLRQLGVRQARSVGRTKTLYQLRLAATVAKLTLVATNVGLLRGHRRRQVTDGAPRFACVVWLFANCRSIRPTRAPRSRTRRATGRFSAALLEAIPFK